MILKIVTGVRKEGMECPGSSRHRGAGVVLCKVTEGLNVPNIEYNFPTLL